MYNSYNLKIRKGWSISICIFLVISTIVFFPTSFADTLSPKITEISATGNAGMIIDITYDGTIYNVADGDLMTGTTTRHNSGGSTCSGSYPPEDADNFDLSIMTSLDSCDYLQTMFDSASDTFFVFENGGNDDALIQGVDETGVLVGSPTSISKGFSGSYMDTGYTSGVGTQKVAGLAFITDTDVYGIRIIKTTDGIDPISISAVKKTELCNCTTLDMTHYWKLDDAGSPYEDSYGDNDATCTNCPTATTGIVGGAQFFDGSDDEVYASDDGTFDWAADDSFTMEYWMNTSESTSGNRVILGRDGGPTSLHWWVGCDASGKVRFQLQDINGIGAYIGNKGPVLNDGNWHHIVAVRNESTNRNSIYVDGNEEDFAIHDYTAGFAESVPLNIGYIDLSPHYRYHGKIDEIAFYDRALTTTEIQEHYNNGLNGLGYCEGEQPGPEPEPPVKIMPLGDSITRGSGSINTNGYRKPLYENLTDNGYNVDFVGSQNDGVFDDIDHEGHGGWTDSQIATNIYNNGGSNWISTYTPDIILLHIGTNGLDSNPGDVEDILDEIDEYEDATGAEVTF